MQQERRKHLRVLTLGNFGRALLVLLVVLAAANVISEMRGPRHGEYGRLFSREEPPDVTVKRPVMVVHEAEVPDVTPNVPAVSLLSGAAEAPPPQLTQLTTTSAGEGAGAPLKNRDAHVTIVGGP